jgi:tol-pal system protein YbgF
MTDSRTNLRCGTTLRPLAAVSFSALSLFLGACATTGGGAIDGGGQPVLSPEERRLQAVEDRLAVIDNRLNGSATTEQDVNRLRDEVRGLRGDIEQLRHDFDSRDKASKQLFTDFDHRIAVLEGGGAPAAGAVAPGATPGTLAPRTTPRPNVPTPEEEAAWTAAFNALKNGKYDDAIRGFKGMVEQWPQGYYVENAWYWMGETYLIKRDYSSAASSFQSLTQSFPASPKMADGLYKLGLAQIELKKNADAKASLERVVAEYPSTNAAELARKKLQQLGG